MMRVLVVALSLVTITLAAPVSSALAQDADDKNEPASSDSDKDDKDDKKDDATARKDAARPPRGSKAARSRARNLFKRGQALIRVQQYDDGIAAIEEAYELDPRIDHLYNLGAAHHIKGDKRKALAYYQKVIDAEKPRELVRLATRFARQLEAEIAEEEAASARLKAAEEAAQKSAEQAEKAKKAKKEAAAARAKLKKVDLALSVSKRRESRARKQRDEWRAVAEARGGGRGKRFFGSLFMIVGGAALGATGAYAVVARQADSKNEGLAPGDMGFQPGVQEIADEAEERMVILAITGGALITTGLVIYILGERNARQPDGPPDRAGDVALTPAVLPHSAGLQVFGRF